MNPVYAQASYGLAQRAAHRSAKQLIEFLDTQTRLVDDRLERAARQGAFTMHGYGNSPHRRPLMAHDMGTAIHPVELEAGLFERAHNLSSGEDRKAARPHCQAATVK